MSEDKVTSRQGFAIGGGLIFGTGLGLLMIAGLGVEPLTADFMENYL